MQVKFQYKLICLLAILGFAFFALIALVAMSPTPNGLEVLFFFGGFPVLIWLILSIMARNKIMWALFFAGFSLYVLLSVLILNRAIAGIPFLLTAVYIAGLAYMVFPMVYFIVRFRKLASMFAFSFSPECRELRRKKKQELWEKEAESVGMAAGSAERKGVRAASSGMRAAVDRAVKRQNPQPESHGRLDIPDTAPLELEKSAPVMKAVSAAPQENGEQPRKLNVNACSAEELLALPGMSVVTAQAAVVSREKEGFYASADDFIRRNQVKPHFAVRMLETITAELPAAPVQEEKSQSPARRRSLDL